MVLCSFMEISNQNRKFYIILSPAFFSSFCSHHNYSLEPIWVQNMTHRKFRLFSRVHCIADACSLLTYLRLCDNSKYCRVPTKAKELDVLVTSIEQQIYCWIDQICGFLRQFFCVCTKKVAFSSLFRGFVVFSYSFFALSFSVLYLLSHCITFIRKMCTYGRCLACAYTRARPSL